MRSTACGSDTSAGRATPLPPPCPMSPTVSAIWSAERATTANEAPAADSATGLARPIPLPPPVTIATWPVRSTRSPETCAISIPCLPGEEVFERQDLDHGVQVQRAIEVREPLVEARRTLPL